MSTTPEATKICPRCGGPRINESHDKSLSYSQLRCRHQFHRAQNPYDVMLGVNRPLRPQSLLKEDS